MKYLWLALALGTIGCADPLTPTLPATPRPDAPAYVLSLGVDVGQGTNAGHATILATVQGRDGSRQSGVPVSFATDAGTLSATQAPTDEAGIAQSSLTSSTNATVTVSVGEIHRTTIVPAQPPPLPPPVDPPFVPPPPPPPVVPPPPQPGYAITVTPLQSTLVAGNGTTLAATVTLLNGATAPTAYDWDCNADNVLETTTVVNHTTCQYPLAGTIVSRVTVRNATLSVPASATLTVTPAAPLTVAITATTLTPTINVAATFTATVTSLGSPLPAVLNWEWDQDGDGAYDTSVATVPTPQSRALAFGVVGVTTIKVRVTDPVTGRIAIGTVQITVVP